MITVGLVACPDCAGMAEATVHVRPDVRPETIQVLGEMMRLAKIQFCRRCKGDGGSFRCLLGSTVE